MLALGPGAMISFPQIGFAIGEKLDWGFPAQIGLAIALTPPGILITFKILPLIAS